jgi:hypothetical protein
MECYSYVNIFETKGLEYILVIVFLVGLVLFARALMSPGREATARQRARARRPMSESEAGCVASFRCPYKLADETETGVD